MSDIPYRERIALTSASFEALEAAGIATEFVVGLCRWTIWGNFIRDGSGRYEGLGFAMQHKGIPESPNPTAVWFKEMEDVTAFYALLTKGRRVLAGEVLPPKRRLPEGYAYGGYKTNEV